MQLDLVGTVAGFLQSIVAAWQLESMCHSHHLRLSAGGSRSLLTAVNVELKFCCKGHKSHAACMALPT